MTDRPILFSAPMVRALIKGRKTQTRRVLKPQPKSISDKVDAVFRFAPGDRLWVRETFNQSGLAWPNLRQGAGKLHYRADPDHGWQSYWGGWRPSLFMPRWASRLTLLVTEVRVERLQNCSEADALAEGGKEAEHPIDKGLFNHDGGNILYPTALQSYAALWDQINGPGAWAKNPWIVAISFTVHQRNIDQTAGTTE